MRSGRRVSESVSPDSTADCSAGRLSRSKTNNRNAPKGFEKYPFEHNAGIIETEAR